MTQTQQVIKYFNDTNNEEMHFKEIASELEILVPNMRRILGQGTLKGIFERVSRGVYRLNNEDDANDTEIKRDIFENKAKYYDNFNEYGIRYKGMSLFNSDLNELYKAFLKINEGI